jgi:uncharacterized phiE125 gp8 family phage protein
MGLSVVTEPAIEPVKIETIKLDLRIDADLTDHDILIGSLISAARRWIERRAKRALITQTLRLALDEWPATDRVVLSRPPLQSITSIKYYDSAGGDNTFSSSSYFADTDREPGRAVLEYGESWPSADLRPASAIRIDYVAGFGATEETIPAEYLNAIRMLVAAWYANPESIATSGAVPQPVPFGVEAMLDRMIEFS